MALESYFTVNGWGGTKRVPGFRFRVSGFRFRVSGFGFQVSGLECQVSILDGVYSGARPPVRKVQSRDLVFPNRITVSCSLE